MDYLDGNLGLNKVAMRRMLTMVGDSAGCFQSRKTRCLGQTVSSTLLDGSANAGTTRKEDGQSTNLGLSSFFLNLFCSFFLSSNCCSIPSFVAPLPDLLDLRISST